DLLQAADWLFPEGMDHHTLMTGSRVGNRLFLKLVRQMGGSGTLPDTAAPERAAVENEQLDVCIVGGGPAGLAAARAGAQAARNGRVALYDEQPIPGGSLLAQPGGAALAGELAAAATEAGVHLCSRATAIGFYAEDGPGDGAPTGVLAVAAADGLR